MTLCMGAQLGARRQAGGSSATPEAGQTQAVAAAASAAAESAAAGAEEEAVAEVSRPGPLSEVGAVVGGHRSSGCGRSGDRRMRR